MKKLFALLLTVVMMASMMVPAMAAYNVYKPAQTEITHSLQLTEQDATSLDYEIVYSYVVTGPTAIMIGASSNVGNFDINSAVTGAPTIAPVTYNSQDNFNNANKTVTKKLTVDWTNVSIMEPGVYRWDVVQSFTKSNAPQDPSNAAKNFYLYMYVTEGVDGELTSVFKVSTKKTDAGAADSTGKTEILPETYPAKTVDLTLSKTVAGSQGSTEQYFPFTITLKLPGKLNHNMSFTLSAATGSSYDYNVPKTAYHDKQTNPGTVEIPATSGEKTFTVWLKHNQAVVINDLIYGTQYTITEGLFDGKTGYNDGYDVSVLVTGPEGSGAVDPADKNTVKDSSITDSATVAYTNTKEAVTQTGINLQSGVAFFGLVLAMGMMMLMFVGKRKEQN